MCNNLLQSICEFIKFQIHPCLPETRAVFKAFADMQIPKTYEMKNNNSELLSGALNSEIYKYHIWSLNFQLTVSVFKKNIRVKLANSTAKMLNVSAGQLIVFNKNKDPINYYKLAKYGPFVALSSNDRYRAVNLLEKLDLDLSKLPIPFRNTPDLILSVLDAINLLTTLGYYHEWSGYGKTKTKMPAKRKLIYNPISWEQIGYPGPSKGYRALRATTLIDDNL